MNRYRSLLAGLALAPVASAHAIDCYAVGNQALDAKRFADAVRAFDTAAELKECQASRGGLLYNKAVALQRLVEAGGGSELACEAAATYRTVIGLEPTSRTAKASSEALAEVEPLCNPPAVPPAVVETPPPPAPDHTIEWALTTSAAGALALGGALLGLALDSQSDRDAADRRHLAAAPGSAEDQAALDDFADASDRTDAYGISGYAIGGIGVALAVSALVTWIVDDEPASAVSLQPSAGGMTMGLTW
ncbi:MAG: hypothetical protein KC620_07420 [Myxococcales bacterium]|nr:hypothetical protein [Myxococcales bacterium]